MAFLSDNVLDNGLNYLTTNGTRVDICSQEPANYTEATSTYSRGNKTGASVSSPTNGDTSGRKVTLAAITSGAVVTSTGTVSHWALSKPTATTELLAANSLSASQTVTSGNSWTLTATDIEIPDPA
jgi:hypothetical protein